MSPVPLQITAHLSTPSAAEPPVMLDGILFYAACVAIAEERYDGDAVDPMLLIRPGRDRLACALARVEAGGRWWFAASGAVPGAAQTGQAMKHIKRSADQAALLRWTSAVGVDEGAGPDKQIRRPRYTRPAWMDLTWTCIGDEGAIRDLLWRPDGSPRVHGIGPGVVHGDGWVDRWTIRPDPDGPPLSAYATDLRVRPLPVTPDLRYPVGLPVQIHPRPLIPPYWERTEMVATAQIQRAA